MPTAPSTAWPPFPWAGTSSCWMSARATWRRRNCIAPSPAVLCSHRIAVLLAGPAMNLLFAALLYAILAMVGTEIIKPVVGQVRLDSPAASAGLQRGDQIVRVGEHTRQGHRRAADRADPPIQRRRRDCRCACGATARERSVTLRVGRRSARHDRAGQAAAGTGLRSGDLECRDPGSRRARGSAGARAGLAGGRSCAGGGRAADCQPERIHFPGERRAGSRYFD